MRTFRVSSGPRGAVTGGKDVKRGSVDASERRQRKDDLKLTSSRHDRPQARQIVLLRDSSLREEDHHGRDHGRELKRKRREKTKKSARWGGRELDEQKQAETHEDLVAFDSTSKVVGSELLQDDLSDLELEADEEVEKSKDVVGGKRLKDRLLPREHFRPSGGGDAHDGDHCL